MQSQLRASKARAFTLIELLVVIAIIAILASILFPVFGRARENGRRSVCQSNLKQVGIAVASYAQDYDEKFPIGNYFSGDSVNIGNIPWQEIVDPYIKGGYTGGTVNNANKGKSIYVCPSYAKSDPRNIIQRPSTSYALNYHLTKFYGSIGSGVQGDTAEWNAPPVGLASVNEASRVVLAAEVSGGRVVTTGDDRGPWAQPAGSSTITSTILKGFATNWVTGRDRHFGGGNYLFVDGHVKWIRTPDPSYTGDITYNTAVSPATADTTTVTPIPSSTVVYAKSNNPSAQGFFKED